MHTPLKILTFSSALFLLSMPGASQSSNRSRAHRISNKVLQTAQMNTQTGVITRGPSIKQKAAATGGTAVSVSNLDFAGFIGVDSGGSPQRGPSEWFNSVHKGMGRSGGLSTYLSSFTFAYCTIAKSVNSGGPGATVTFNFWDGFINGNGSLPGSLGTNVGSVTLTGLPGHTGTIAWASGGFARNTCTLFTADVSGGVPIVLPDSNIAVSFRFDALGPGGVLGDTATFLSCVQSCSAAPLVGAGPRDNMGMNDYIDRYATGTFQSSFSFVTSTGFTSSFTSINFQLTELIPLDASNSIVSDNGPADCNSSTLTGVLAPRVGGSAWIQNVDCGTIQGKLTVTFSSLVPINPIACGVTKHGTLLINPAIGRLDFLTTLGFRSGSGIAMTLAPSIPFDLTLVGSLIYSQGYCANSSPMPAGETRLTNRLATYIGTIE